MELVSIYFKSLRRLCLARSTGKQNKTAWVPFMHLEITSNSFEFLKIMKIPELCAKLRQLAYKLAKVCQNKNYRLVNTFFLTALWISVALRTQFYKGFFPSCTFCVPSYSNAYNFMRTYTALLISPRSNFMF